MHPLRAKRKKAGLSVSELGRRVGLTRHQIERIERGEIRMLVPHMLLLAGELGCELSEIIPPAMARTEPSVS